MRVTPSHRDGLDADCAIPSLESADVSRRAILVGAAATTAMAAVLPFGREADAQAADPKPGPDMVAFLLLSAALTGVHVDTLAPEFTKAPDILRSDPGVDPINVKDEYFAHVQSSNAVTFGKLLDIARRHPISAADIITAVNASDDTKFLARSITLLWYLGSWYEPQNLKSNAAQPGSRALIDSTVVSAKAYTQGLIWKIVQAHPMGYSDLQFGYWARDPNDPNVQENLGFITTAIP